MTIEIHRPELEALILQRMESGAFDSVEDVILQALKSLPASDVTLNPITRDRRLDEMFAVVRGLADDLDFSRNPSMDRSIQL